MTDLPNDPTPPSSAPAEGMPIEVIPPPSATRGLARFALKAFVAFLTVVTASVSVWVITRDGNVLPATRTPTTRAAAPAGTEDCTGLRWRPPEGAVQADLPEGVEERFPLSLMTNCVLGVEAETQVTVWFKSDGSACGLDVTAPEARRAEVRACIADRLVGTKIFSLPKGQYATMDVSFR
jgi:hypothetical protein